MSLPSAAKGGIKAEVERLLSSGADVNQKDGVNINV